MTRRKQAKTRLLFEETDIRLLGAVSLETGRDAAFEFELLAESYHLTANAAVEALAANDSFQRAGWGSIAFRAFPVIFLYRQALELTVKAIIISGAPLAEYHGDKIDRGVLYREHNFEKLRPFAETVMKSVGFGWDFGVPRLASLSDFRRLLAEFDQFDPSSTTCRYPVDGSGKPSFGGTRTFNLYKFAETMDSILEALAVAPGAISSTIDEYFSSLSPEHW